MSAQPSPNAKPGEETLFARALELPASGRAAFLAEACGDDVALRQRVEGLLAAHEGAGAFLDKPAGDDRPTVKLTLPVEEGPGTLIGRYKLLEKLGEGGFGVVYVAEQREPVRRRVALKIIKLGMDTRQVVARFEAERQALALMDHPNISKVLDAGSTETGRPYFVMELVRGVRLTDYCDQNNLSTRGRLDLFIKVCQAIQHAHQKGIIHRDIKPSNLLVTLHDGVPVPKVIDFGIAKATQGELTDKTVYTQFQQFIGTPAYMSPEQAEMSGLDIDTRSDIYALGVLLYELLTGRTPFDQKELLAAGLDEMRRIIREQEPVRPSTRVSSLQGEDLTTTAKHHASDAPKLIHLLRGDLDWIVMKCLEKDRTRRYETANGVAMDIQRHLQHEPVVACPPTNLYRFQKLVRRNKLAFAAASAVAAALVIGLGISTWMFFREKQSRQSAVTAEQKSSTEAAKSQQVAQFLKDMLKSVGPSVALGRDTTMLREILDQTGKNLNDLKGQPAVEADLRAMLANVYSDLGEYTNAAVMYREALVMGRKLHGNEHPEVAASLHGLGLALWNQGKLAEAETLLREALAMRRKLFGNQHRDVASSLHQLGGSLRYQGKLAESETVQREALAMRRKLFGNEHAEVALSLNDLGSLLISQDKVAEAEPMHLEALATRRKLFGNLHPAVAEALDNLASVFQRQGKLVEAETMHREALAMQRKLMGNDHPLLGFSLNNLGNALWKQGRLAEAETMFREAVAVNKKLMGNEHPYVAMWRTSLARVLQEQGKFVAAETLIREALAMERKESANENRTVDTLLNNLAAVLHDQGKLAEAEAVYREELAMERKLSGNDHPFVANSLNFLANLLREQGKLAEAETMQREALVMRRKLLGNEHPDVAASLAELTTALLVEQKFTEVEPLARECLAIREKKLPDDWRTFNTRSVLGGSLLGQKKYAEAEPLLLSGYEGMKQREDKIPTKGKPRLKESLQRLVQLYEVTDRPDQAAEWKKKLTEFDKAEVEKKAVAPQP